MTMPLPSVTIVTQFLTNTDTKFDECLVSLLSLMGGKMEGRRKRGEERGGGLKRNKERGKEGTKTERRKVRKNQKERKQGNKNKRIERR